MAKKDPSKYRMDVEEKDWEDDIELPDLNRWEGTQNRPTSLRDLDHQASEDLENVENEFTNLGDLAYLNEITETEVADDSISTPKLQAKSVEALNIDVADLSAINADLGQITAGTVTGALIRTADSDTRVEMDGASNELVHYQDGNIRTVVTDGQIYFNRPDGLASGAVFGYGTNTIGISVGGSNIFQFNASQILPHGSGDVDLGSSFAMFDKLYLDDDIEMGGHLLPTGSFGQDLGDSNDAWDHLHIEDIYSTSGRVLDIDATEGPQFQEPMGLDTQFGTPGSASDYEGYMYYDTNLENIVYSDGVGWFQVQASAL